MGTISTLEQLYAQHLVIMQRALDETPGVIELGLDSNMILDNFFLVLQPQHLDEIDK